MPYSSVASIVLEPEPRHPAPRHPATPPPGALLTYRLRDKDGRRASGAGGKAPVGAGEVAGSVHVPLPNFPDHRVTPSTPIPHSVRRLPPSKPVTPSRIRPRTAEVRYARVPPMSEPRRKENQRQAASAAKMAVAAKAVYW